MEDNCNKSIGNFWERRMNYRKSIPNQKETWLDKNASEINYTAIPYSNEKINFNNFNENNISDQNQITNKNNSSYPSNELSSPSQFLSSFTKENFNLYNSSSPYNFNSTKMDSNNNIIYTVDENELINHIKRITLAPSQFDNNYFESFNNNLTKSQNIVNNDKASKFNVTTDISQNFNKSHASGCKTNLLPNFNNPLVKTNSNLSYDNKNINMSKKILMAGHKNEFKKNCEPIKLDKQSHSDNQEKEYPFINNYSKDQTWHKSNKNSRYVEVSTANSYYKSDSTNLKVDNYQDIKTRQEEGVLCTPDYWNQVQEENVFFNYLTPPIAICQTEALSQFSPLPQLLQPLSTVDQVNNYNNITTSYPEQINNINKTISVNTFISHYNMFNQPPPIITSISSMNIYIPNSSKVNSTLNSVKNIEIHISASKKLNNQKKYQTNQDFLKQKIKPLLVDTNGNKSMNLTNLNTLQNNSNSIKEKDSNNTILSLVPKLENIEVKLDADKAIVPNFTNNNYNQNTNYVCSIANYLDYSQVIRNHNQPIIFPTTPLANQQIINGKNQYIQYYQSILPYTYNKGLSNLVFPCQPQLQNAQFYPNLTNYPIKIGSYQPQPTMQQITVPYQMVRYNQTPPSANNIYQPYQLYSLPNGESYIQLTNVLQPTNLIPQSLYQVSPQQPNVNNYQQNYQLPNFFQTNISNPAHAAYQKQIINQLPLFNSKIASNLNNHTNNINVIAPDNANLLNNQIDNSSHTISIKVLTPDDKISNFTNCFRPIEAEVNDSVFSSGITCHFENYKTYENQIYSEPNPSYLQTDDEEVISINEQYVIKAEPTEQLPVYLGENATIYPIATCLTNDQLDATTYEQTPVAIDLYGGINQYGCTFYPQPI